MLWKKKIALDIDTDELYWLTAIPVEKMSGNTILASKCKYKSENFDPARTRTWNPLIRSQMPYPLGHRAMYILV